MQQMDCAFMSACVKHNKTNTSYCVLQKVDKLLVGGVPVLNEMDCPLVQATQRFRVVPSTAVMGSISLIHECNTSCRVQPQRIAMIERERTAVTGGKTFAHDRKNTFYSINTYCINYYSSRH